MFELDPGAELEQGEGWLLAAGGIDHPVIANVAFRIDDELDAAAMIARARSFFAPRKRGFSIWSRAGAGADRDLSAAAAAAGLHCAYEMPAMVLGERVQELPLPAGAELRAVETEQQLLEYWRVAASAYASLGFPPELFEANRRTQVFLEDQQALAFLAYLDGEPVSIAMTLVNHGVAGIYWVGSLERARGRGLGRAVTAAACNAGFELGAEIASLQASPMGEPIYSAIGFERIYDYELLLCAPPQDWSSTSMRTIRPSSIQ